VLKSEIIDSVAELTQDSTPAMRGMIGRWVNFILDDIASRGHLKSLQREEKCTMIAGNGTDMNTGRNYDLNVDTDKIFKCFVPDWGCDGILKRVSPDHFLTQMLNDGARTTGQPRIYTVFGLKTLRLHPIPDSRFAPVSPTEEQKLYIWKYKDPAHLTEQQEITEWKVKHTPLIVSGAYAYGARFDALGDFVSTKAEYEMAVVRLFRDEAEDLDLPCQVAYNDS
jgi:hypothetical protein